MTADDSEIVAAALDAAKTQHGAEGADSDNPFDDPGYIASIEADGVRSSGLVYVDKSRLLVESLYEAVVTAQPLAVHPSGDVWLYRSGRYIPDRSALAWLVAGRLGDYFKPDHLRNFVAYAAARLYDEGRLLTPSSPSLLVNVANGMLDPLTGNVEPHDPAHLSTAQMPVEYDPDVESPVFDWWLEQVLPDEELRTALIEDAATVLDRRGFRQKRALFLVGPTRSGKSTFARLLEALVGTENSSSEEIHDLSVNRFRAAELFTKVLNVASDIRSAHLGDVSLFKKATGDDTISAERKFGHPFRFRFTGLFLWTMNDVPTTDDTSRAYLARIRPYRFAHSFEGRENPDIEARMMRELPGIVNRLVDGLQRLERRGGPLVTEATTAAAKWFAHQSDRVALFLAESTVANGWTPRQRVYEAFTIWAKDRRRGSMTRRSLYAAIEAAGHPIATRNGVRGFALTVVDDYDHDPGVTP